MFENENAVIAEIQNKAYDVFELKIFGFTEENRDSKLALGAFVSLTNDGGTTYSCMQVGAPNQGDKYSFVSYSDVLASLSK